MCKKVMFLVSLVCLLGVASSALAADLIVNWPDIWVVPCVVRSSFRPVRR
ncbi:MAG: hypothetical protein ACYST6_20395 [Planctomycetota bacterium]